MMTGLPLFNQWTPVEGCSSGGAQAMLPISEAVTVDSVNAFAPLSHTPASNSFTLFVNGRGFSSAASPPDFAISGNAINWLSTTYSVSPGDDVVANYFYIGTL